MMPGSALSLASYKLRFFEVHVRAVPARDEAGCPFAGPGVDLRGETARAILDDAALIAPFREWLAAREPGVVLRSMSVDVASGRVLITLEPASAEQRPRVVRIDRPTSDALLLAAAPLERALSLACLEKLRRRRDVP